MFERNSRIFRTEEEIVVKNFQEEDQILFEAIEAYRNGDGGKATFIYESTKKYTYKIVHQEVERFKSQSILTGDAISITEDVMQDLYLNFFNNIAKFRNEDPRSIFKWISIVSHRMLLDYVDKNKMEVLQFEKDEDYREDNDIWDSSEISDADLESSHELLPEAALEDKEFQQLILDFIQSLPEVQAQTVLLHFRGGMKYQEIADEMGVSLITVKTRMKKAKDSLEEIITKYEKKTGTKLHSVSILPLLWLLYRMSSESTTVPVAVDTTVTSSVAGASGVGMGGVTTVGSVATKAISTRVLVAIVSTAVVIGGVAVGSQIVGKKQESNISTERDDLEDSGSDDNQQDNDKVDKDTSNKETDEGNSETNQNETAGDNNGSDTNNTGSDDNVTQNNTGNGTNTNGTSGNTGAEENANGTGSNTNNSGNDSGSEDTGNGDSGSESTEAKGTKENPYRIGEKIVVTDDIVYNPSESDRTDIFHLEFTVTDFVPMEEALSLKGIEYAPQTLLEAVQATIKIVSENTVPNEKTPIVLTLVSEGSHSFSHSGMLYTENDGRYSLITDFSGNKEHDINVFCSYSSESIVWTYLEIKYYTSDGTMNKIYVKLE